MCGILYTSFNLSNDEISKTESLVKLRGPDHKNIQNISGNTFVHYLLHITGAKTPQPLIKENSILIYNGEIYNYKKLGEYESDGYSILDVFNNQNIDGLRSLDGEFSGVIKKENFIYIFRDTFGTKPLFFSEDQRGIAVASYQSQLHALGFKSAKRAPVNCVLRYNSVVADEDYKTLLKRGKLSLKHKLIKINKKQYDQQKKFVNKFCEEFKGSFNYSVRKDKGAIGTGIICELAKKDGCKVYLSGQGSDEILSDYGYNGNGPSYSEIKGLYPESLESIFPWENVYNGQQENFIMKDENIGGAHSIECRYPFLDTNLVQEFLYLSAKLKNKNYKSFLKTL
jgi:asparagine synthetase B (glutamine-hydrolysing)